MHKKPNQIRAFVSLAKYSFRAQTRNPATFFFGFIFPIVFISIFGLIGGGGQKLTIGISTSSDQNNPVIGALKHQRFVTLSQDSDVLLENKLKQGKLSGIISVTKEGRGALTVHLKTSIANPQEGGSVSSLVRSIVNQTNLQLSGIKNPPVIVRQTEVTGRQFRYIDFALPGQIGFSLLSTAIFGTVFGLIYLKKSLVFKRMFATPTQPLTILLAQGMSRLIIALLQTLLILLIGVIVFQFYLPHGIITFIELIGLSAIGLVAFLGFGYFFAGLASDENSAGPLVNLVTLPQFLLSGTFFPTENLPAWLQPVANNLPLSYFNQAIRQITTEGGSAQATLPYMIGLIAWGIVMYLLAAKTFRWV